MCDFWASWCIPCRAQNPLLIELYAKYHHKGLEIISIADDDNFVREWKDAIHADGTGIWQHVLRGFDEKRPGRDISKLYGISSIPAYILVNKQGEIVFNSQESNAKLSDILMNIFDK